MAEDLADYVEQGVLNVLEDCGDERDSIRCLEMEVQKLQKLVAHLAFRNLSVEQLRCVDFSYEYEIEDLARRG